MILLKSKVDQKEKEATRTFDLIVLKDVYDVSMKFLHFITYMDLVNFFFFLLKKDLVNFLVWILWQFRFEFNTKDFRQNKGDSIGFL